VRPRVLPLNAASEEAFRKALKRAYREQYIFPFRANRALWEPRGPASKEWLRSQTRVLRKETGVNHLNAGMWRNQLCKEMLEQGVPTESVIWVMGQVSEKMLICNMAARLDAMTGSSSTTKMHELGDTWSLFRVFLRVR
jgi:hypothetical protein